MKAKYLFLAVLMHVIAFGANAGQDIIVIVNKSNTETSLSKDRLRRIYYGKELFFTNKSPVAPLLYVDEAASSGFIETFLGESVVKFKKYWVKRALSAQGTPPKQCKSEQELLSVIKSDPGAIAFIRRDLLDSEVKVVAITDQ